MELAVLFRENLKEHTEGHHWKWSVRKIKEIESQLSREIDR